MTRRRSSVIGLLAAAWLLAPGAALAAQGSCAMPLAGPKNMATVMGLLNTCLTAIFSSHSGATAPANNPSGAISTYQVWVDTSTSPPTLKIYDGAQSVAIGTLDSTAHLWAPSLRQIISAGTSGALAASGTITFALQPNPAANGFGPLFPLAGKIKNLFIATPTAPGAGQTFTATVFAGAYPAGSSTVLTCTMSNTTNCSDVTHSVSVSAGQSWYVSVAASGAAATSTGFGAGFEFDSP